MESLTVHVLLSSMTLRNVLLYAQLEADVRKLPAALTPEQAISELVAQALQERHDVAAWIDF